MRRSLQTIACLGGAALAAGLTGCQAPTTTRITVMNESSAPLLLDVAMADSEDYIHRSVPLDTGGVRAFVVDHGGPAETPVQVGVRPDEFAEAAAQWLEFEPLEGPYLLRVQGTATSLRFLPSKDTPGVEARGARELHDGRLGAEPPVNPRR